MHVTALAGGIGAGKFLRGLVRAVDPTDVTVIVNTADDIRMHGLHVSPDVDSVTYWLGDAFDRERGWGRRDETFRATEELRRFDADAAWFSLGDLDLATHLFRTRLLAEGRTLSDVTARVAARFGVASRILPMSDDAVTTRITAVALGHELDLHFQEYWVQRHAQDDVKAVRYEGVERAAPAAGVLEAIGSSEAIVICPSNPVASIGPILAVPGMREALQEAPAPVVAVSPFVGGRAVKGPTEPFMAQAGLPLGVAGVLAAYEGLLDGVVSDERPGAGDVPALVTDTLMDTQDARRRVAGEVLEFARGLGHARGDR